MLEIYLIVKGDFIDGLKDEILEMEELGALHTTVLDGANIFYYFASKLDITFIRFHGSFWVLSVASFLSYLRTNGIEHIVDANGPIPFVLQNQDSDEIIEVEGKVHLPPIGDIEIVLLHADRTENKETVEEAAKAIGSIPTRD